jgi:DNA polymerase
MTTFHAAHLIQNPAISERRKVWEDLMLVMEKLGIPVSERQRGFFLQ